MKCYLLGFIFALSISPNQTVEYMTGIVTASSIDQCSGIEVIKSLISQICVAMHPPIDKPITLCKLSERRPANSKPRNGFV